jgi:hypothetical protein
LCDSAALGWRPGEKGRIGGGSLILRMMIRKMIVVYAGIAFGIVPCLYSLILYVIEALIPKETKSWSGHLSDHFGAFFDFSWGNILSYYSVLFLGLVLAPYASLSYASFRNRGRRMKGYARFGLFFFLQGLTMNLVNIFTLLFNDGHAIVKWVLFLLVTSAICTVIPDKWLYDKIKS